MEDQPQVFHGSGNVFADLGLSNPEERQVKAHLSIEIEEAIKSHRLTQKQAAQKIGLSLEDLAKVVDGDLSDFSINQLIQYLNCLGRDVTLSATVSESVLEVKQAQKAKPEAVPA